MTRYDAPESFWHDLEAVARGGAVADLGAVRRIALVDEQFPGLARRDIGTSALGALVPVPTDAGAASGPPVSRRPFLDALARSGGAVDFPAEGMSFTVPAATTAGVTVYGYWAENVSVTESDPLFAALTVPVQTVAARVDFSRQAFDRGAVSGALTAMVVRAVDAQLERTVVDTLVASSSYVTLTGTTGGAAVKATLNAAANVAGAVVEPAEFVVVAPRRVVHWGAQAAGAVLPVDFDRPSVAGIPMIVTAGMSTTHSSSQDRVTVGRWDSLVFTEDAVRARVVAGGAGTGTGTVSIVASKMYGFVPRGYASALQTVSGSGLVAGSFA